MLVPLLAAEFLDVQFLDARPQDANPLLGPAVVEDIAHIEMPPDRRAVEFVHVARSLQRAKEEMVPHVLNGDLDAQLLCQRDRLADFRLRPSVGVRVGDLLGDHARHQQHRGGAITFGVAQGLLQSLKPFRAHLWVRIRERLAPVVPPTNAGNGQAGLVARAQHFVLVHVAHHLGALEAGFLDGLHLLQHGALHAHRAPHDALLEAATWRERSAVQTGVTRERAGGQRRQRQRAACNC